MTPIDWPKFINWIVEGTIVAVLGIIGGYIGAVIENRIRKRQEEERNKQQRKIKEQQDLRASLMKGVPEFVEKEARTRLQESLKDRLDMALGVPRSFRTVISMTFVLGFMFLLFSALESSLVAAIFGFLFFVLVGFIYGFSKTRN